MKIITKKSIYEYKTKEVLKREIKIQKKLDHPHICKLHHCFEDKDNVYLVLEYAENGSLFHYVVKRGKLKENEAFVYFFQTCLGIDYLHKKRIIHRDLKVGTLIHHSYSLSLRTYYSTVKVTSNFVTSAGQLKTTPRLELVTHSVAPSTIWLQK